MHTILHNYGMFATTIAGKGEYHATQDKNQ